MLPMPLFISWASDTCAHLRSAPSSPWWRFQLTSLAARCLYQHAKVIPGRSISPFISGQPHCCLSAMALWIGHMKLNSVINKVASNSASHARWGHSEVSTVAAALPWGLRALSLLRQRRVLNPSLALAIEQTSPPQTTRWMKLPLQLHQCQRIATKNSHNKRRFHSTWSRACEVFLSSPLSLVVCLSRL